VTSLRIRLVLAIVVTSIVVAGIIVVAVMWFSMQPMRDVLIHGASSPAEADAMIDQYIGSVVAVAALAAIVLGGVTAWWIVRSILRPLQTLSDGTRRVASGDLAARVDIPRDVELAQVAESFNHMAASLQRAEELRRAVIEDVAHELRTPLTTLRGYTEALADGVTEPTRDMLAIVHGEIERLTRLVEELDAVARNQDGRQRAAVEIDLGQLIRRALALAEPMLDMRNITVRIDESPHLPTLLADVDAIDQVIANLVQNAVRYASDGGEITVRLSAQDGTLLCAIANSGPDIPTADLPLIWERLHRVDRSRARTTGGAGIGLAIVRQIVESYGGQVGASSQDGTTEIWFRLPVAPASG
jgi:signal transduction histidine kinase